MLTARELMTPTPVTATPMTTVRSAVELLHTLDIRHLPIVDEDGELVGMISDRDLRMVTLPFFVGDDAGASRVALDARVASIMSGDVLSVEVEADAAEVVDLMLDFKIGAIPVVDDKGVLVGIISYIDILRALPLDAVAAE
jgi:acetoin utilization protein AcuB